MCAVTVGLGDRSYPILIGSGLLRRVGTECARRHEGRKCVIVSDSNVAPLYASRVIQSLKSAKFDPELITVKAGEKAKSLKVLQACYDRLAELRLERKSFIVALGGGVVGDLAGFLAATYMRGVPFVQVPTTLLAQVVSSVGGKVGVNLDAGKNLVGAFYQPGFVLCDLSALETLPDREFRAGLGEVIKYGIIYDAPLFAQLERDMPKLLKRNTPALASVVARCCEIKSEVVGQDETESGLRAILNFGHTIGHAIEAAFGYGRFLHGEAVSIGSVAAAQLSQEILGLPENEARRITALFNAAGLPTTLKLTAGQRAKVVRAMTLDKKAAAGQVKFVLARRIGQVEFGQKAPADLVNATIENLQPSPQIE